MEIGTAWFVEWLGYWMNVWGNAVCFQAKERDDASPKHTDRSRTHFYSYLMDCMNFSRKVKLEGR
jgi:hypothetical protein